MCKHIRIIALCTVIIWVTGMLCGCSFSETVNKVLIALFEDPSQRGKPRPTTPEPETVPSDDFSMETLPPEEPTQPRDMTGEVTASVLNVRKGPGTNYEIVKGLERGSRVLVYECTQVGDDQWGRITDGWISMQYIALDSVVEGNWYELLRTDFDLQEYTYRLWSFQSDGTFSFTVVRLRKSDDFSAAQEEAQGGGTYILRGGYLELKFTHGDTTTVCSRSMEVSGRIVVQAEIIGATMTWQNDSCQEFARGTLKTVQKKLKG